MGAKKKQRSENVQRRFRMIILDKLFKQKLQDLKFEKLVRQGFIKEIKDGKGESVHL